MLIERNIERAVESATGDGVFNAAMATEGEAADGHIISVRGIHTAPSVPMLFGHYSSEQIPLVGSWRKPTKSRAGVATLRQEGQVNLNGDGILSEFRRGLYQLIEDGDLNAVSIRIDVQKATPRRNLSADHPAFIDVAKIDRDDPRHMGVFIERSSQKEGSLVAIGADPAALIGRADAASNEHVKDMFRALSHSVGGDDEGLGDIGVAFTTLRESIDDVRELGIDDDELTDFLAERSHRDYVTYDFTDADGESRSVRIRRDAYDALYGESHGALRTALAVREEIERERFSHIKAVRQQVQEADSGMGDVVAALRAMTQTMPVAVAKAASNAIARELGRVER